MKTDGKLREETRAAHGGANAAEGAAHGGGRVVGPGGRAGRARRRRRGRGREGGWRGRRGCGGARLGRPASVDRPLALDPIDADLLRDAFELEQADLGGGDLVLV